MADRKNERDEGRGFGQDSDYSQDEPRKFISGTSHRKKPCRFCTDSEMIMDYKNARAVYSYLTEHGKIVPRRISGNCAFHQRRLTTAIKQARQLALVGYSSSGM